MRESYWAIGLAVALSLRLVAAAAEPAGFHLKPVDDNSLGIWEGEQPVLVYNHGTISREGVPARYDRANYVHPLYGLDGEVLTDDFPRDHYHHRGVFWAWPGMEVAGKKYDSWIPSGFHYKLERWVRKEAGKDKAVLEAENGWYAGGKKVVAEQLRIVAHPATETSRSIDIELVWTATDQPVQLWGAAGKSYGGLTVRYNTRPNEKDKIPEAQVAITVPEGRTKKDLAIARLHWADLAAPFPGAKGRSGAAVFIDKTHPDYPPTWLTRHYGCLCVGWPGVKPGTLEPGKPVTCRYRLWVHRGEVDLAALKKAYEDYVNRPQ